MFFRKLRRQVMDLADRVEFLEEAITAPDAPPVQSKIEGKPYRREKITQTHLAIARAMAAENRRLMTFRDVSRVLEKRGIIQKRFTSRLSEMRANGLVEYHGRRGSYRYSLTEAGRKMAETS